MSERELLIRRLKSNHGVKTDDELMDSMQSHGLISDNCIHLSEAPTCDLKSAYEKSISSQPLK